MDSIYDLIMDFLKRQSGSCVDCQWRDRKLSYFIKKDLNLCSEDERKS